MPEGASTRTTRGRSPESGRTAVSTWVLTSRTSRVSRHRVSGVTVVRAPEPTGWGRPTTGREGPPRAPVMTYGAAVKPCAIRVNAQGSCSMPLQSSVSSSVPGQEPLSRARAQKPTPP